VERLYGRASPVLRQSTVRLLCALGVAGSLSGPSRALAEPPATPPPAAAEDAATLDQALSPAAADEPRELVLAREAFRDGSLFAKKGRWVDALAAFRRSAELRPHPITTYDIGYCERALGHYVRAYDAFESLLRSGPAGGPPPLSPERTKLAESYLAEVSPHLVRLTITPADRDLTLRVDGLPIEPLRQAGDRVVFAVATGERPDASPLPDAFELWLDPGTHLFLVTRKDGGRAVEAHTFAPGATATLRVAAPSPKSAPTPPANPEPAPRVSTAPVADSPDRTWAFVAFGVGAAGLVAGSVFYGMAVSEKHDLDASCPNGTCPDETAYHEQADRVGRLADFATVGFVTAAVGAGVGTYLWVTAKPSPHASGVAVGVGAGTVSVAGRF
jgi:hypothetical protein